MEYEGVKYDVYPACAGIHPVGAIAALALIGLPRMRGDPPPRPVSKLLQGQSTPHARGSTFEMLQFNPNIDVYPACAGIDPAFQPFFLSPLSLPRMRGDPPMSHSQYLGFQRSTPHARGSTRNSHCIKNDWRVYPACAGIHLVRRCTCTAELGLPRMRGDPPGSKKSVEKSEESTPHARGSTFVQISKTVARRVYPACAGIHPLWTSSVKGGASLPRMRGDPPQTKEVSEMRYESTPHARGSTPQGEATG